MAPVSGMVTQDLQQIFEQAPVILNAFRGPDHVFIAANASFRRTTGKSLDVIGKPVREAQPELAGLGLYELLDRVYETGVPFVATEMAARVDRHGTGTLEDGFFNFSYQPIRDASGGIAGVLSVAVDVTDLVAARRDAERSAERARLASARAVRLQELALGLSEAKTMHAMLDAVVRECGEAFGGASAIVVRIVPDHAELEILRASDMPEDVGAAWRRFPLSAPVPLAIVARTGRALFLESRADWDAAFPQLRGALEATGHHAHAVLPLVADGRVTGALGIAFHEPRPFDDDERALAVAIARQCAVSLERSYTLDLARQSRIDAEQAQEAAERANRAKSDFLAVMSHELRTPLNAIAGYAELIELGIRGPVTPAQREDLGRIRISQRHLLGLINEVLNYARLETGSVHYDIAPLVLGPLMAEAHSLVAPQASARGILLIVEAVEPALVACADPEKLRQILVNLLTNAVKFTERGGHVVLAVAGHEEGSVCITIADTGIGIAPENIERIFEPFVQVRADFTRTAEGTGLGLAISRDLARGMGGELTARSEVGVGSTFTLRLRATPEADCHASAPSTRG